MLYLWKQADVADEGSLAASKLSAALRMSHELPLTSLQMHSVMSAVQEEHKDANGFIYYTAFAPKAARIIERLLDPKSSHDRARQLAQLSEPFVKDGLSADDVRLILLNEFAPYDPSQSGKVSIDHCSHVLVNSELALDELELNFLKSMILFDTESDLVLYVDLCDRAYEALLHIAEMRMLDADDYDDYM